MRPARADPARTRSRRHHGTHHRLELVGLCSPARRAATSSEGILALDPDRPPADRRPRQIGLPRAGLGPIPSGRGVSGPIVGHPTVTPEVIAAPETWRPASRARSTRIPGRGSILRLRDGSFPALPSVAKAEGTLALPAFRGCGFSARGARKVRFSATYPPSAWVFSAWVRPPPSARSGESHVSPDQHAGDRSSTPDELSLSLSSESAHRFSPRILRPGGGACCIGIVCSSPLRPSC